MFFNALESDQCFIDKKSFLWCSNDLLIINVFLFFFFWVKVYEFALFLGTSYLCDSNHL